MHRQWWFGDSASANALSMKLYNLLHAMTNPVNYGKEPWQLSIDCCVMSVLSATVLQMNSEANNLILDSDHHNACPSVHVSRIGSKQKKMRTER